MTLKGKNKFLRSIIVCLVAVAFVAGIAGVVYSQNNASVKVEFKGDTWNTNKEFCQKQWFMNANENEVKFIVDLSDYKMESTGSEGSGGEDTTPPVEPEQPENQDTEDLMNKFKHPLIKCLISDFCPKESAASSFPMAYGNFVAGDGGIPKGGSRAMALRMEEKFKFLGGKSYTNKPVKKIIIEDNLAKCIVLENNEEIYGDYIIVSCDMDYTFNDLLDKSYMDPVLKMMYENDKDYLIYGMFQVAYGIDSEEDLLKGEIMLDCSDIKIAPWMGERMTIKTYSYEPSFAPENKQILQVLLPLDVSAYDYWMKLYEDKEEYDNKKKELAQILMKKIEENYEGYKDKMTILDSWTPVTYKRYCNAYKGYNQAFVASKNADAKLYPSPYVKNLDNVILCGQWITPPGGVPGAAITGKFAIQRILKKENKDVNI